MEAIFFYIFSGIAVLFAFLVIWLRNPMTSALSLVASFFGVSGIFVILHAPFVGVIQILIYAGAILVLFLYVTMLLNLRSEELVSKKEKTVRILSLLSIPALFYLLSRFVVIRLTAPRRVGDSFGSVESVGELLLSHYAMLFEIMSLVLLVGIIGAVLLGRRQKEGEA